VRASSAFDQRLLVTLVLCALSIVSVPLAEIHLAGPAVTFVLGLALTAAIVQIATFACLAALYRTSARPSEIVLGALFLCAGIVATAMAVSSPLWPDRLPVIAAEAAAWFYVAWHAVFAGGACAYAVLRARESDPARWSSAQAATRARTALTVGSVASIAIVGGLAWFSPELPRLVTGSHVSAFGLAAIGPFLVLLGIAAIAALGRLRDAGRVDRALLFALVAITLDIVGTLSGVERYTVGWLASRLLYVMGSGFVLTATVGDLVRKRDEAAYLERRLQTELLRAKRHAARLQKLWRLGSVAGSDEQFMNEIVDDAAHLFRENERFAGLVVHREDAEIVVDVASEPFATLYGLTRQARFPLDDALLGYLLATGTTASWSDIRLDPRFELPRSRSVPWRALIGSPFRSEQDYCLCFASTRPLAAEDAFDALDHAYVETLASICANRLQKRAQTDLIAFESEHDQLTRLYNRRTFRARGIAALEQNRRVALVVADLGRFRTLNDSMGHHVGDTLLQEVGSRLLARLHPGELLARLGGDSFGILLADVKDRADVAGRVARFSCAFDAPFECAGDRERELHLSASYGIALAPDDANDFEQLLARADAATYEAKESGRSRWAFFDPRIGQEFGATQRLRAEILKALERNEFVLHFQPHVELRTGRPAGAEALIRWQHPERGLVPPSDFIPFAEKHGLAPALGEWVMRETIAAAGRLRATNPDFRVWFNLSATELDVSTLSSRVEALGGPVSGVGVEITETSAMRDVAETARAVALLRSAGFAIALDDFGTGYSSLAHLRRLPIDVVKIDRSFVSGLPDDPHDVAIVEAVLSIAERFGFKTVAEGVETAAQAALLATRGCSFAQGYAYAKPMPFENLERWLVERQRCFPMVRAS
jgi:diguanylate cyclase (GGDEF)-like protein